MPPSSWRDCTASHFICEKQPARASRGMVVTNHPLASAAGARILADGGNAIDAAMAGLFALTVVEPMMIGLVGGGLSHIRTADGAHVVIDAMSAAPAAATPTMYRPVPGAAADVFDTIGNENLVGPNAVATPGSLRGWCAALTRYGTMTLADVMAPAIELAAGGFRVTPYLSDCIASAAPDLLADPAARATFLPDGDPLAPGRKLVRGDYADTLRHIAQAGEGALHGGPLGALVAECIERRGGSLSREDLATYQPVMRAPVRASYRGWEIVGPPPPSAAGVHIAQMLGILEGYDIASLGFATPDTLHLLAEVLKIAFADRAAATADPAFVAVPVERLISKEYAAERRAAVEMERTQAWGPGVSPAASPHTTHLTVADAQGNIVASTHTINSLFGARFIVPGTGLIPNNYMVLFDPRPGHALSVAPGKRVTTSMAPMMALRDGKPVFALGLPGGKRIFPSAMQALVNLIDHGMSVQEAVEAPRIWTEGNAVEVEPGIPQAMRDALAARGHAVLAVPTVAGGMNAIRIHEDGTLEGAACWRADGTPIGLSGGLARAGVRFTLETPRRAG